MRVLVVGGTVFLGRHLVDAALHRGDDVTILHRGRHPAHRAGEVTEILGDRTDVLDFRRAVDGLSFDAVVDTCGYLPADVRLSAAAIDAGLYVFVSSASVYADSPSAPLTEESEVLTPLDPSVTDVHGEFYGAQKAGCEVALRSLRPDSALILRAGLLVGPHDPTDRLTYWAMRMRRPGPVLAPDVPDHPVQVIDARDLAGWILRAAAAGTTGTLNVTGPRSMTTLAGLLELAADGRTTDIRWVAEDRILDAGVAAWSELPLWVPTVWNIPGVMDMDVSRAEAAGLTVRPLRDTVRDLVEWASSDGVRVQADYGTRARSAVLTAEREAEVLTQLGLR